METKGFSLIEMAIVLIIISTLFTGTLPLLRFHYESKQLRTTEKTMRAIKDALYGYVVRYKRLPCADTNDDGIENCPAVQGTLPWMEVGAGRFDAWGNIFKYAIDSKFITSLTTSMIPNELEMLADVDENPVEPLYVPVIIWSRGKMIEPQTPSEFENANNDGVFTYLGHLKNGQYDDIVTWLNYNIIMLRLVESKQWPE